MIQDSKGAKIIMKKIFPNRTMYELPEWYSDLAYKLGFRRISKTIVDKNYYANLYNGDICTVTKNGRLKQLKPERTAKGYLRVHLKMTDGSYKKIRIHRLIGLFIENHKHKAEINHINLDKANNCIKNLEWTTHEENVKHYHKNKKRRLK